MKRCTLTLIVAVVLLLGAMLVSASDKKKPVADPRLPLMLDEVHYYLTDPASAIRFFETHFGAHELTHPGSLPLRFITMLGLEPGEGVIDFSPPGPYDGFEEPTARRWSGDFIAPAKNLAPRYGVFWLGLRTTSLKKTMEKLESRGVAIQERHMILPGDYRAKAATVYGPDFNLLTIVERPKRHGDVGEYGLDHVQLLVKNVEANAHFLEDVFSAQVASRSEHTAIVTIADFTVVLSDPEALELNPADVQEHVATHIRFEADHLSFLFSDLRPAVDAAIAKGRKFAVMPRRMEYYGKATPYTYAVIDSPDGLPFELISEDGRTGPRTHYVPGK